MDRADRYHGRLAILLARRIRRDGGAMELPKGLEELHVIQHDDRPADRTAVRRGPIGQPVTDRWPTDAD
jgi:hypothetical protein